jgi:ABC-2 type transport system permease protein
MRHTFSMYIRLLSIQIRSQMQYRGSFFMDVLSTGMLNGVYFLALALVLQRFDHIAGWTLGEIAFLAGMMEMSFGTMDLIFSGFDPDTFGQQVRMGRFDQILLRPLNITVQILGSAFLIRRLGRIFQGLAIFVFALVLTDVHWTLAKLLYLPVVYASMVVALGALFIFGATLIFWTVQPIEAMNILTYGGNEMMTYPMSIYPIWIRRIFTYAIPFIFLNYYPALYFLDKPDPLNFPAFASFISPFAALAMLAGSLLFWRFGLKHYQSTGS